MNIEAAIPMGNIVTTDKSKATRLPVALPKDDITSDHVDENDNEGPMPIGVINLYLKDIGYVPFLSAQEEAAFAIRMEQGGNARITLAEKSLKGGLTEKHKQQYTAIVQDGKKAENDFTKINLPLVVSIAKEQIGKISLSFDDSVQAGNIGLARAIKKFDYRKGFKFSTYATWWIRQAMQRESDDSGRTIRIPTHVIDDHRKMRSAIHDLTQELGRDPKPKEIGDRTGLSEKKVRRIFKYMKPSLSLDWLEGFDDGESNDTFGTFVVDVNAVCPQEKATKSNLRDRLNAALDTLPVRDRKILQLRYKYDYTQREVAKKIGISYQGINQHERMSLTYLRRTLEVQDFYEQTSNTHNEVSSPKFQIIQNDKKLTIANYMETTYRQLTQYVRERTLIIVKHWQRYFRNIQNGSHKFPLSQWISLKNIRGYLQ